MKADNHNDLKLARNTLDLVCQKWRPAIIYKLYEQSSSFTEISSSAEEISNKMLAKSLKDLERNEIITKENSRYILTEKGVELKEAMDYLVDWSHVHLDSGKISVLLVGETDKMVYCEEWLDKYFEINISDSYSSIVKKLSTNHKADIVMIEASHSSINALELTERIKRTWPEKQILLLYNDLSGLDIIRFPADSFLKKPVIRRELRETLLELNRRTKFGFREQRLLTALSKKAVLEREKSFKWLSESNEYSDLVEEIDVLEKNIEESHKNIVGSRREAVGKEFREA